MSLVIPVWCFWGALKSEVVELSLKSEQKRTLWSSTWQPWQWQGRWNWMIFRVTSNLSHSMILWFKGVKCLCSLGNPAGDILLHIFSFFLQSLMGISIWQDHWTSSANEIQGLHRGEGEWISGMLIFWMWNIHPSSANYSPMITSSRQILVVILLQTLSATIYSESIFLYHWKEEYALDKQIYL